MAELIPREVGGAAVFAVLAVVFELIQRSERRRYLRLWTIAFVLLTTGDIAGVVAEFGVLPDVATVVGRLLLLAALVFVGAGSREFLGLPVPRWLWAPPIVLVPWTLFAVKQEYSLLLTDLPVFVWVASILVDSGVGIYRAPIPGFGRKLAAGAFVVFGGYAFAFPFLDTRAGFESYELEIDLVLTLAVAMGIYLMHFERARAQERAAREQLEQSRRLEALGRLAGGIAHDFNNLLTAILAGTDFVRDAIASGDDPGDDLESIREVVCRASGLTTQLLAFSRQQVTPVRPVDLVAVARHSIAMLRRTLGEGIELRFVAPDAPQFVEAGSSQLDQIVMNLALNARDAMEGTGTLTIEIDPRAPECRDCVVMRVTDTGSGMDAETLSRAFEPFYTTKGPGKGTGLGLASVYGIVQQLNGEIEVGSEVGHGTTFVVRLPRSRAELPEPRRHSPAPPPRSRVLLVEDEEIVRDFAARALRRIGYDAVVAHDGKHALELAAAEPFDALVTDVVMPGMSGPELARTLRGRRPELPVVFMSGYTADQLEDGIDGAVFLAKPFQRQELAAALDEALGHERRPPAVVRAAAL